MSYVAYLEKYVSLLGLDPMFQVSIIEIVDSPDILLKTACYWIVPMLF